MAQAETQKIAFLRAINVGGHVVKMEKLRSLFGELEFERVTTFIASGNVLFETANEDDAALEEQIEAYLEAALGYPVATFIRGLKDLTDAATYVPFPNGSEDGSRIYCGFLKAAPPRERQAKVLELSGVTDEFHFHGRELYWLCRVPSSESEFSGAVLEKLIRAPATLRNMTTVRKIAELATRF